MILGTVTSLPQSGLEGYSSFKLTLLNSKLRVVLSCYIASEIIRLSFLNQIGTVGTYNE